MTKVPKLFAQLKKFHAESLKFLRKQQFFHFFVKMFFWTRRLRFWKPCRKFFYKILKFFAQNAKRFAQTTKTTEKVSFFPESLFLKMFSLTRRLWFWKPCCDILPKIWNFSGSKYKNHWKIIFFLKTFFPKVPLVTQIAIFKTLP